MRLNILTRDRYQEDFWYYNLSIGLSHLLLLTTIARFAGDYTSFVRLVTGDFNFKLKYLVIAFLLLSSTSHLILLIPKIYDIYFSNLQKQINYFRWVEYSISSSIMMVILSLLVNITSIFSLLGIFIMQALVIGSGFLSEKQNAGYKVDKYGLWLGYSIYAFLWVLLSFQFFRSGAFLDASIVNVFISMFVLFSLFPINNILSLSKRWGWKDYMFTEKCFTLLSLLAKGALALQIYGFLLL